MAHVFISYSRDDKFVAQIVVDKLRSMDHSPWIDFADIGPGKKWEAEIKRAIRESIAVVVVLTPSSVQSQWVKDECMLAEAAGIPIIPILMIPCELPEHLTEYQYIDFHQNDKDKCFDQLCEAISTIASNPKADPERPTNSVTVDERALSKVEDAHVLVVVDNVPNFVLISRLLAHMGVNKCEWKTSGWQVVQSADTLPQIDLIILHIRLPYEDGYQALEKVRNHPRLSNSFVVALATDPSEEEMLKAQSAGFNGLLGVPLDPDRFPEQIRRILNGEEVWEWQGADQ